MVFLHWHSTDTPNCNEKDGEENRNGAESEAENGAEKATDETVASPPPIAPDDTHQSPPQPVPTPAASGVSDHQSEPPQRAKYWRENLRNTMPRPDGSLRHADRAVLVFLRANIAPDDDTGENLSASANGGLETRPLSHREVGEGCGIASRTAQVALRRLTLQRLITPLPYTPGSREGRRYRFSTDALRSVPNTRSVRHPRNDG